MFLGLQQKIQSIQRKVQVNHSYESSYQRKAILVSSKSLYYYYYFLFFSLNWNLLDLCIALVIQGIPNTSKHFFWGCHALSRSITQALSLVTQHLSWQLNTDFNPPFTDMTLAQWARKFKKSPAKKTREIKWFKIFFSWNCISGSFKLFPSSKIDFWPFLKLQKMEFGQKNFFVKLIYLISQVFFGLDFFQFSGLVWNYLKRYVGML